jgi:alpha-galactosidase
MGLRAGIYSSPGATTCGGFEGSAGHEADDARAFAAWGFDYLKYDWCSAGPHRDDLSLESLIAPYRLMRDALDRVDRDIVYHLCQYGLGQVWRWARERVGANAWRTTGDIEDTWASVDGIGFGQADLAEFAGPGGWNDPDMLVLGSLGGAWNRAIAPARLTPDEERTHLGLWALLAAPLLLGCDVTALPDRTLGLLLNPELIAINQDVAGRQATRVSVEGEVEFWVKQLADGTAAIGIFNRGESEAAAGCDWTALGLPAGVHTVRDVWARTRLQPGGGWQGRLSAHGSVLLRVGRRPNLAG